jgi:hypothetical protein
MKKITPLALLLSVLWVLGGATGCASRMGTTGSETSTGLDLASSDPAPHPVGWTVRLAGDNP